ncbi:mucin-5AC isoform X8 [Oncorhynchus kisutch]|uniref:mucin-5AC isoform X8 n=1 Tax=Oncorhynchus kisutch TaxID=8019 RepID=UPI0012DD6E9A|nr:mucin-5AC isoform X8 [Oncorhynchus kisutch]
MTLFIPDMAGRLFLLILLFDTFQYLKAKDLSQPSLTVIPAVIKERDSVQLNCQTPPSVSECYFKIEGKVEFLLPSPCQQTLTGTLLVRWTGQSSPAEVKIQCQYSAKGSQFRSIYSEPSTVTITDLPQLTVSSTVIRETESVQLSCETPPSLPVSHCYFNIEGRKNLPDSLCTQTITGTELLKRSGPTFPAVVKVTCYYTVWKSHTSPFSDPVSVTVQDPKPDITVHFDEDFNIICLIPGSFSPDTTCNLYVGEESQPSFTAKIMKRKATSASKQWFCQFTPKHSDLISRLQSVRRKEVSCDYRLSSGPNSLSPRSDGHSFTDLVGVHISDPTTIQTPSIAVSLTPGPRSTLPPSTTASPTEVSTVTCTFTPDTTLTPTTSLTSPLTPSRAVNPSSGSTVCCTLTTDTPASPTERGQSSTESEVESNSQESILLGQLWQAAVGVASGVGVFLVGLTAVCLCRRTKKTNSLRPTARQDDHRQCDLVMGAMSSAGMLDSRDAGIYSLITSVPSTFLPSGPFEENGKSSENDNSDTFHIYSSIPDRPATSAQPDGFYSLLQTH